MTSYGLNIFESIFPHKNIGMFSLLKKWELFWFSSWILIDNVCEVLKWIITFSWEAFSLLNKKNVLLNMTSGT